jgi:hypothetical protein
MWVTEFKGFIDIFMKYQWGIKGTERIHESKNDVIPL